MHITHHHQFDWFTVEHFTWTPGCYLVYFDDAYNDIVYCDGSWFYRDEACTIVFEYAHEIQGLCRWEGFPIPPALGGQRRLGQELTLR